MAGKRSVDGGSVALGRLCRSQRARRPIVVSLEASLERPGERCEVDVVVAERLKSAVEACSARGVV